MIEKVLKTPFESSGGRIKDANGRSLLDLYELAFSSKDGDYMKLLMEFVDFTVAALNEKWKRDYGSVV